MGIILSRFRKKKSAEKQLEEIEKEITEIENNKLYAVQREKYIVWRLFIYSSIIYIISAVLFYVYFFPASLRDQIFYMIPLLIFPVIIFFVKKTITWIYGRKITKDKDKLVNLMKKKKDILDDVMNTETYKVAKKILDKYAPEQVRKPPLQMAQQPIGGQSPMTPLNKPMPGSMGNLVMVNNRNRAMIPPPNSAPTVRSTATPIMAPPRPFSSRPKLIRPVFPPDRSYLERLIDAISGEGPANRYALICKNCASHNGMARKEEFDYLAFRCVYCGFPNPALKTKPRPQLSLQYNTEDKGEDKSDGELNRTEDNKESGVIITEVFDPERSDACDLNNKTEEEVGGGGEIVDSRTNTDGLTKRNVIDNECKKLVDEQEKEELVKDTELEDGSGDKFSTAEIITEIKESNNEESKKDK